MKLPQLNKIKWNYLALAFAVPVVCLLAVMLCGGYSPFSKDRAILYSDMYHQYYPFFVSFRKSLLSGDGLLYTWNIGMGLDYLGLISYYLASPLNLLSVLVPEHMLLGYFSLLVPIKLGLASLFFALFLKKIFHKDDLSIALFGGFYGLCAWALGYQWNIMWLDSFALLPLVALGTVSLLRNKKFFLYTVTLFLSIYSNYYIGLFTCIFVLLTFICYEICRFKSIGRFFFDLSRIAFFSILAIGMTAVLELPALAALQTTQSSINNFPEEFRLNIVNEHSWKGLFAAMQQVAGNMGGGLTPTFKEGLPNIYSGVGTIILAFLFLTCKQIKIRDKVCAVLLLLFFIVSFIVRQLDYIWHGFHFPNMIPYRFSFLFSFVILYMAYRAYLLRKTFRLWQIILAAVLSVSILWCSKDRTDVVFLVYNGVFMLLYLVAFLYPALLKRPSKADEPEKHNAYHQIYQHRRRIATFALSGTLVIEIIMNVINFGVTFPYTNISNYPHGKDDTAAVIQEMKKLEENTLFYRSEVTHTQTLNDSALNGYNGITTFTSSANVAVTKFMQALGYGARDTYNRYCFEEASPVSNLFLNLKYMIERNGDVEANVYFDPVYSSGNVTLIKNNAYLPLGFLADPQLINVDFKPIPNNFVFQNKLLQAATGIQDDVWYRMGKEALIITTNNATIINSNSNGFVTYKTESSRGKVIYRYTADKEGFMCLDFVLPKRNSFTVSLNGELLYSESYSLPQMLSVSDVKVGDVVEITLTCNANERGTATVQAGILDEGLFRDAYNKLSASTLELTTFNNACVEGKIQCNRDGLLYTSIPQNGNWSAYVDGHPVDIVLIGDAMIGIPLSEGFHTVTFRYHNAAFSLGWKITLVCVLIFGFVSYAVYLPRRTKGRFEK